MSWRTAARFAVSLAALVALGVLLDASAMWARLRSASVPWVALGLLLTVPQALVLAWRWRLTARRLGIDLPFRTALAEYYLGNFLNQVLPGGITGDASRAWRHVRTDVPAGPAIRAVILERLSAQVVMSTLAAAAVALLPTLPLALRVGAPVLLALVTLTVGRAATRARTDPSAAGRFWSDAGRAVLDPAILPIQAATALFVVGTYVGVFVIAARAIDVTTPPAVLVPLVPPILMTMLLPVSIAGWGLREGAAAALWGLAGLTPEAGVAVSVTYGLLALVSTLPGALVLVGVIGVDPGRRGRPPRVGSDAPAAVSPPSGSGRAEG